MTPRIKPFEMRLLASLSISISLASAFTTPNDAQVELDASFDNLADQLLAKYHVPGLSLALIDRGKVMTKVLHRTLSIARGAADK